jgi:two-component system sensor kinase FixL
MAVDQHAKSDPNAERRRRAEEMLGDHVIALDDLSLEDTRKLVHELHVHQIELEIQNEELREAQFQIETMRDQFADLYDFAPVGYLTLEINGMISQANLTSAVMLGRERWQLIQRPLSTFVFRADQDTYYRHFKRIIDTLIPRAVEVRLVKEDGTHFFARLDESPVVDREGKVCQCRVAISDITTQKQADAIHQDNEILRATLEKERELAALRDQLMLTIAHEFRTPLSIILTSSTLLEQYNEHLTELERREKLGNIRSQVRHLSEMLDSVTFVVRAKRGSFEHENTWVDPVELCSQIVIEMRGMTSPGHRLIFSNRERVGRAYLDQNLLRRVLVNLISNAIKYSPDGGTITLRLSGYPAEFVFEVSDEGIGIPEDDLHRLYEPFFRASNVGAIDGIGIGLSTVQEAIHLLGGSIECTSQLGAGTTFTVVIPVENGDGHASRPPEDPGGPGQ